MSDDEDPDNGWPLTLEFRRRTIDGQKRLTIERYALRTTPTGCLQVFGVLFLVILVIFTWVYWNEIREWVRIDPPQTQKQL
jgi:hypothetical protein